MTRPAREKRPTTRMTSRWHAPCLVVSMRHRLLGAVFGVVAVGSLVAEHEARACGGGFLPPTETETVTTDHRMIFSISDQQTTLYDQIEYHGSPASFAWVLPIKGTVTVGLSADILFDTLDSLTATQVVQPTPDCPAPPDCGTFNAPGEAAGAAAEDAGASHNGVTVTGQAQVGPYETVQLHSTDGSALTNWLTSNGFSVPSGATPILAAYVAQQFDFLAMKLIPGKGVEAMQPVRVTSTGSSATLPMRMVFHRYRRDHRDHALGGGERALGAAERPLLQHHRLGARVGLDDQLEQLRFAPALEGGRPRGEGVAD